MPNRKVIKAAEEMRRKMRPQAKIAYREHGAQARALIRQLAGPTQEGHDRAFDLLSSMGEFVVTELLEALDDMMLDPIAADEIVSLLGTTGDERAQEPIWQFLQNQCNPDRICTAAMSLAGLGDDRALPYLRRSMEADDEDLISDAVAGMIMVGQMEDIALLRQVHRHHHANREIRFGVANAILTIAGEADQATFNRTLDDIQASFADRDLWDDIWAILESEFGNKRHPIH